MAAPNSRLTRTIRGLAVGSLAPVCLQAACAVYPEDADAYSAQGRNGRGVSGDPGSYLVLPSPPIAGADESGDAPAGGDPGPPSPGSPYPQPQPQPGAMPPAMDAPAPPDAVAGDPAQAPASGARVDIDTRLHTVLDDLMSIPVAADRRRQRYLDLSPLANAGRSDEQLDLHREALSLLVNSLSGGRGPVPLTAIDAGRLIYRLDLRTYAWDETTWRQLETLYPYAVRYDEDSRLFPYDELAAERIREETGTDIPVVQADWFISHASRPPLYYSLLGLPDSLSGLERVLGVDIQTNIERDQVLRAGFADAVPSNNNRVIERHELGGNAGALWLTYDFENSQGVRNVFAEPLGFVADVSLIMFHLPNGLQGYFVVDTQGARLDEVPTSVLRDPTSRDGSVEPGLSCVCCHLSEGVRPRFDEIRDFQLAAGEDVQEVEQVLALYATRTGLTQAFDRDRARYAAARQQLGIASLAGDALRLLDDTHLAPLDVDVAAAVAGLAVADVERAIDASPQSFPAEILTLRGGAGTVPRDAYDRIFGDFVRALGLGEQLRVQGAAPAQPRSHGR